MMSLKEAARLFKKYKSFLISTHVNPDPDALCSELALYHYLRSIGKKAVIVNNGEVPQRLSFLPGTKKIKCYQPGAKLDYEAAVVLDCGNRERVGKVLPLIESAKEVINIDHHITNDNFGTHNVVKPAASSTAEILYDLLREAKCKMTDAIALHLYAGIMTDTGSFRHENTTSRTHEIVADLMRYKFSATKLYQQLYEMIPLDDMKHFTQVVSGFDEECGGKVICVELKRSVLSRFSRDFDLRDTIFKFLRSIKGVEVVVIFTEMKAAATRVNFRSAGRVDVAKVAHSFDGGGHHNASGCLLQKTMAQSRKDILKKVKEYV